MPVLAPPPGSPRKDDPVFTTHQDKLIPDPTIYSDWFDRADDRRRRLAVGTRRLAVAQEVLGHAPSYEHLVDPLTGDLLSTDRLRAETLLQRAERLTAVRNEMARRREDIKRVAVWGYQAPAPVGV